MGMGVVEAGEISVKIAGEKGKKPDPPKTKQQQQQTNKQKTPSMAITSEGALLDGWEVGGGWGWGGGGGEDNYDR